MKSLQLCLSLSLIVSVFGDFNFFRKSNAFPLDENNHLNSHWLVHSNNENCHSFAEGLLNPDMAKFRKIASVDDPVSSDIFGETASNSCHLACLDKGAPLNDFASVFPEKIFQLQDQNFDDVHEWLRENCLATEVGFISHLPKPMTLYWIGPNKERIVAGTITYGNSGMVWQQTTLGHEFEVVDESGELYGHYVAEHHGCHVIGGNGGTRVRKLNATQNIKDSLSMEMNRAREIKRTFSSLGFVKSKLPRDIWSSMSAYYYNNRENVVREDWENKGFYVNWWEVDPFMIEIPWQLKKYWQRRLQTLVEEWAGAEMEMTDIYGMRRYEEGARLLTHVDRTSTHAASLIINVAQHNVVDDWKVEIYDHADRLHEISMEPGDIVYYESARCLHGRMKPLMGAGSFYVNIFSHYRPTGDPLWHTKQNPPGTASPLLDIGKCTVADGMVSCSKSSQAALTLSPSLHQVNGEDDLFDYWKAVSPQAPQHSGHDEF